MTPLTVRGIEAGETEAFLSAMSTPFGFDVDEDAEERSQQLERFSQLFEPERARCAFDGDTMVGTLGVFSLDMTVPGARVACAGTTMVTVLPTHRRRGALRAMIAAHLEEARLRGDPIAALWASDSGIYHRFGYGMASVFAEAKIHRGHIGLHRMAAAPLPVRLVGADEARDVIRPVYDRVASRRPGMYARDDRWWARRLRDPADDREGATAFRYAVVDGPDGVEGYVQYRLKPGDWAEHHGNGEVKVREILAETPQAAVSLWSFIMGHDLVATIETGFLAEDDPLFSILDGWRRAMPTLLDQLWVRILDISAALEGRRYSADGQLSVAVTDPLDRSVTNFRLTVEDGIGTVTHHTGDAELTLDLEDLSAAYLGRSRFRQLARAGRLTGTPETLALADAMFGWDPAPWCQEVF
jgi:predicted acetyltransferase